MATALTTASPLKIDRFTNRRTGTISFRVSGTHPKLGRVRKNFSDEEKAQAYLNANTPRIGQLSAPVLTILPEIVVRQAEAAFVKLPAGTSILQAAEFYAIHHRSLTILPILKAIDLFIAWSKTQRKNQDVTTDHRKISLVAFAREARVTRSDQLTESALTSWIYAPGYLDRTHRDRFDLMNLFCKFLVKKNHALRNPVIDLDRPVVRIDAPGVITFEQTWRLLQTAVTDAEGPDMLPFFAVCVLSGVRPDEVRRLTWENIYLDPEHRLIEVNEAKGGRSRRNTRIIDPLCKILAWCKEKKLKVGFFSKRKFDRIRRNAGLYQIWEKDLLRHTYASHQYTLTKDIKQLHGDMGNSELVLFQSYIRPVPKIDGERFMGLILHYSSPRAKSMEGCGPKPRNKKATARVEPPLLA